MKKKNTNRIEVEVPVELQSITTKLFVDESIIKESPGCFKPIHTDEEDKLTE